MAGGGAGSPLLVSIELLHETGRMAFLRGVMEQDGRRVAAFTGTMRKLRSEEHTSELQSLMRISYAVFCLKKKTYNSDFESSDPLQPRIHGYSISYFSLILYNN